MQRLSARIPNAPLVLSPAAAVCHWTWLTFPCDLRLLCHSQLPRTVLVHLIALSYSVYPCPTNNSKDTCKCLWSVCVYFSISSLCGGEVADVVIHNNNRILGPRVDLGLESSIASTISWNSPARKFQPLQLRTKTRIASSPAPLAPTKSLNHLDRQLSYIWPSVHWLQSG